MTVELFEVGGCVRDEIMGRKPNDIDYTCIAPSFEAMREFIENNGLKIAVESPQFFTIRAIAPKSGFRGHRGGLDFVWAREEGPYSDGRRPDWVKPGTLMTDLARRDFTFNAMAKSDTGEIIDPFNGRLDISNGVIRAVGDPKERMLEDSLRVLRALRFSVQLGFGFDPDLLDVLYDIEVNRALKNNVSAERKMDEINKMFKIDTIKTLRLLDRFWLARNAVFNDGQINLMATMKTKGFNNSPKPKKGGSNMPPAYNGCECVCHTEKGVMHMSACCHPSKNS